MSSPLKHQIILPDYDLYSTSPLFQQAAEHTASLRCSQGHCQGTIIS